MSSFRVRPGVLEDFEGVKDIWHHKDVVGGLGGPTYPEDLKRNLSLDRYAVAVDDDDNVVGFCGVANATPHKTTLNTLGVHPDWSNRGVSERLYLYWVIKSCLKHSFSIDDHVITTDNPSMVLWLLKMRFKKTLAMRSRTRRGQTYAFFTLELFHPGWQEKLPWLQEELKNLDTITVEQSFHDNKWADKVLKGKALLALEEEHRDVILANYDWAQSLLGVVVE